MLVVRDRHPDVVGVGGEFGGHVDRLPAGERLYRGQVGEADEKRIERATGNEPA